MNALVLCGGGLLGAVEVGLLRAVEERASPVDLIVGTSVGAVNGRWGTAEELAEPWRGLRGRDLGATGDSLVVPTVRWWFRRRP